MLRRGEGIMVQQLWLLLCQSEKKYERSKFSQGVNIGL
jgi:hypothetical protein